MKDAPMTWRTMESAPKDGTWFLAIVPELAHMAWGPYGFCAWTYRYTQNEDGDWVATGEGYWCETDTSEEVHPTHWIPLPDPTP